MSFIFLPVTSRLKSKMVVTVTMSQGETPSEELLLNMEARNLDVDNFNSFDAKEWFQGTQCWVVELEPGQTNAILTDDEHLDA